MHDGNVTKCQIRRETAAWIHDAGWIQFKKMNKAPVVNRWYPMIDRWVSVSESVARLYQMSQPNPMPPRRDFRGDS
jgi:hypothetical protein